MWAWVELNHRHPRYKRGALTPELHARLKQQNPKQGVLSSFKTVYHLFFRPSRPLKLNRYFI